MLGHLQENLEPVSELLHRRVMLQRVAHGTAAPAVPFQVIPHPSTKSGVRIGANSPGFTTVLQAVPAAAAARCAFAFFPFAFVPSCVLPPHQVASLSV